jgi:outer membrane cobalamin receptor
LSGSLGRTSGSILGTFVGRRTDSDFLFPSLGLTSNASYFRIDIAGSFRLFRATTAIGRIDNVLARRYQDELGCPSLGRALYIGMRFRVGGE